MTTTGCQIDLLRHGAPEGGKRYRGDQVDDPLSPLGWAQLRARVADCHSRGTDTWDAIISSPMTRCRAFAEALAEERGLPLVIEPDLREIGFGVWEGHAHHEIPERFPEQYRAFKADPVQGRPPGAEPMDAFYTRVTTALERHARAAEGKHLLIVAHAVVMRAAAAHASQAPLQSIRHFQTELAALLSLGFQRGAWQFMGLNNQLPAELIEPPYPA
ncbi:histidine phosphatase family protein [Halothiobacillus sp. DCM-1]|uniref:histidine phosphatase family protein n=1 Tax=Halothiobacillus sp. DCM-1 TaxID=3112558 RepID=UPI0032566CA0